jgi:signal transduction histidine kinase
MLDGALHSLSGERAEEARGIIETALAQQRATIRELRDLSFALEPVVLRDHGFAPALRAMADQAASSHGVAFDVEVDDPVEIGEAAGIALYTILRELVDQALRRGTPTHVRIVVSSTPDGGVVAIVADDAEPERRRRSLAEIEERVVQLHGTLEVRAGDEGTETRVWLPAHTAHR